MKKIQEDIVARRQDGEIKTVTAEEQAQITQVMQDYQEMRSIQNAFQHITTFDELNNLLNHLKAKKLPALANNVVCEKLYQILDGYFFVQNTTTAQAPEAFTSSLDELISYGQAISHTKGDQYKKPGTYALENRELMLNNFLNAPLLKASLTWLLEFSPDGLSGIKDSLLPLAVNSWNLEFVNLLLEKGVDVSKINIQKLQHISKTHQDGSKIIELLTAAKAKQDKEWEEDYLKGLATELATKIQEAKTQATEVAPANLDEVGTSMKPDANLLGHNFDVDRDDG